MSGGRHENRSPELDQVRRMLWPELPVEEGWARIDAAFAGARQKERPAPADLTTDLEERLREWTDED